MDSILQSVKKSLGIQPEYDHFDEEIILDINTAFFVLNQLGVGPEKAYSINSADNTWDEFLSDTELEIVKAYIPLRVKLMFDPPSSSYLIENINKQLDMFEFRMLVDGNKRHDWYGEIDEEVTNDGE